MITLHPHQKRHLEALIAVMKAWGAALDASDTGTGKTYVALALAKQMGVEAPLVLCPKSVAPSWRSVAHQMGLEPEVVGYEKSRGALRYVTQADGSRKRISTSKWGHEVFFGNGSKWVWDVPLDLVIFDEAQRCGGMTSLNSKLLIAAKRQAKNVLCLSATAADDPRKMKALGFALELFDLPNFKWWMLQHGVKSGLWGGFSWAPKPEEQRAVMQKLHKALFPHRAARMVKKDIAGFPETLIRTLLLEDADGKASRLLAEIEDLYRLRMIQAEEAVSALDHEEDEERPSSVLVELLRRRQALEALKVPDLIELAVDYSETSKVVVFCHFSDSILLLKEALEKRLKCHVPVIDGSNTPGAREIIRQGFQTNQVPVLLCNAAAGGVGLSLHDPNGRVERTALICPGWSATQFKQIIGRVHRDGGAFSQQILVGFEHTLEVEILRKLAVRANNLDTLNDGDFQGL